MYPRSYRIASTLFPLVLGGILLVSTGPAALRTVTQASLFWFKFAWNFAKWPRCSARVWNIRSRRSLSPIREELPARSAGR